MYLEDEVGIDRLGAEWEWSGVHRLVAALDSACRMGSVSVRGTCMCLDEIDGT